MAEARARRNQGKFARLRAMADRNWRCSRAGDFGLALWNKRAVDCVYEFVVCRVSGPCILVRFVGEDEETQIVPEKMPVVTTSSADLMQELRAECRVMWPKLFSASDEDSDDDDGPLKVFGDAKPVAGQNRGVGGEARDDNKKRSAGAEAHDVVKIQRTFPSLDSRVSTSTPLTELNLKYYATSDPMSALWDAILRFPEPKCSAFVAAGGGPSTASDFSGLSSEA